MFATGQALAPGVFHIQPRQQGAEPDLGERGADGVVGEVGRAGGIAGGLPQRAERQIGPLRQEQMRAGRGGDAAGAERPDAGQGAEDGGFALAGAAGDQG